MPVFVYNTLTRKKEEFQPYDQGLITMYVCGVTPYDEVHLGHARVYVTFDVIRRFFEHAGFRVKHVQNFTDIDDKIIARSRERGESPTALAARYIADYFTQMGRLNVKRADAYPRVTGTIPSIIRFIEKLVGNGKAYVIDGDVYFQVRKFKDYGMLSGRSIDDLLAGARVEVDERKKDALDFALWKKAKPDDPEEARWDSPWGKGRPGWHIECSAMAAECLGTTIDIHGGGQDLIFPHHENEIAQSESATGARFVRYWIHNGFVTLNREKMSKSLGNFFTLSDIFRKYPPRVVRYFLLSQHYRGPLDFSDDKLEQAAHALEGIDEMYQKLVPFSGADAPRHGEGTLFADTLHRFRTALSDDFNTEKAIAVVHELKKDVLPLLARKDREALARACRTLTLFFEGYLGIPLPKKDAVPDDIVRLANERSDARKEKDWTRADALRAQIDGMGYKVEDNPDGTFTIIKSRKELR